MIMSYSQAGQDIYVEEITQKKINGTFLEIGSNHPIEHNNTYLLEKKYNWKGIMVEYDSSFKELYTIHRPNSIHILEDARKVNYRQLLDYNDFPDNIDYLQIDLDVNNKSTIDTLILLNNTVFDKYKFSTVTFEHDIYSGDYFNTQQLSRQIFENRGYILVFPNVSVFWEGSYKPFEDWYVHKDLVDPNLIDKLITPGSLNVDQIKKKLSEIR